mgnify:CR=1 FL=1
MTDQGQAARTPTGLQPQHRGAWPASWRSPASQWSPPPMPGTPSPTLPPPSSPFGMIPAALVHRAAARPRREPLASTIAMLPDPSRTTLTPASGPPARATRNPNSRGGGLPDGDGYISTWCCWAKPVGARLLRRARRRDARTRHAATNQDHDPGPRRDEGARVEAVLAGRSTAEWVARFGDNADRAGPIYSSSGCSGDPRSATWGRVNHPEMEQPGRHESHGGLPGRAGGAPRAPLAAPRRSWGRRTPKCWELGLDRGRSTAWPRWAPSLRAAAGQRAGSLDPDGLGGLQRWPLACSRALFGRCRSSMIFEADERLALWPAQYGNS